MSEYCAICLLRHPTSACPSNKQASEPSPALQALVKLVAESSAPVASAAAAMRDPKKAVTLLRMSLLMSEEAEKLEDARASLQHAVGKLPRAYQHLFEYGLTELNAAISRLNSAAGHATRVPLVASGEEA